MVTLLLTAHRSAATRRTMSTHRKKSKNHEIAKLEALIRGVRKHLSHKPIVICSVEYTAEQIIAVFQHEIDNLRASSAARTAWLQSVKHQLAGFEATTRPMIEAVHHTAAAEFGLTSDEYREFGFQPPRPPQRTPESKVIAADKLRATRKARGTKGKRQRKALKGSVPEALREALATHDIAFLERLRRDR
jgi:hypothetical protein